MLRKGILNCLSALLFWLAMASLACQNNSQHWGDELRAGLGRTSPVAEGLSSATEGLPSAVPVPSPKLSARAIGDISAQALEALALGKDSGLAFEKTNHETLLYLMRAARYPAAYAYALRLPEPSRASDFIAAKAAILSRLELEAAKLRLERLLASERDLVLRRILEEWRLRAIFALAAKADAEAQNASVLYAEAFKALWDFDKKYAKPEILRAILIEELPAWLRYLERKMGENVEIHKEIDGVDGLLARLAQAGNSFEKASLGYWRYRLAAALGKPEAAQHLRRLVLYYPATQMARWPALYEESRAELSPKESLERSKRLIAHFDYDNAREALKALLASQTLSSAQAEEAEWLLAKVSLNHAREPQLSEAIYRRWSQKAGPRQEEAHFNIARALSRQGRYLEAIQALEDYEKRYPKGKERKRSLYLKGWYYFELRDNDKARPYLLAYAEQYGDSAVWGFYAQTFIREERWQEAIEAFKKLLSNGNPIVRGKALYWQAYAYQALGKTEQAQALFAQIHEEFPLTYYDILAHQREEEYYQKPYRAALYEKFRESDSAASRVSVPWGRGQELTWLPKHRAWQELLNFVAYDEIALARQVYRQNATAILKSLPQDQVQAFELYATQLVEDYYQAWQKASGSVRALSKVQMQRRSARHQMAYPQAFAPLVEALAQRFGIPNYFIYGIMLQESRFRPYQISSADAIGALQMIPRTAKVLAGELGLDYQPETFYDPKVGFIYSVYYMRKHLDLWRGNLTMAAASYNGGPHRIGPWMIRDEGVGMDKLVEEFSFDESRHYARKVAEHSLRYLYLYSNNFDEFWKVVEMLFPRTMLYPENRTDWGI